MFLAAPAAALAAKGDWDKLAAAFPVDRGIANFNHAGVGTTPIPVAEAVQKRMWQGEKLAPGKYALVVSVPDPGPGDFPGPNDPPDPPPTDDPDFPGGGGGGGQ